MDIQLLTQADFILSACGRPTAPSGLSVVYIPKGFTVNNFFAVTPGTPTQTVTKEITGDTDWCLREIQILSATTTAQSIQILLPNGRFLISNLQDVLQIAGYGSYRYLFTKELECPPGSKIQVTFQDTNTGVAQPLSMLFGGAYKYFMKSGASQLCPVQDLAARLPRVFGSPNQNIMAPAWQQGIGCPTPAGFQDQEFVYGSILPTSIDVAAGPFTGIQTIPIDQGSDFRCRKLFFAITAANTVTAGTFLVKLRTGSGYSLTDDYIDVATYINSAPFPIPWRINKADNVYADLQLVDQTGTGLISIQTYMEGVKRWRIAA